MSPNFAAAVDPIFLHVLALLERAKAGTASSPEWERQTIENLIREAEAQLPEGGGWPLAKFALAAWIDDMLISTEWAGRDWWENNSLEFAFFKTRERATQFFINAKEAAELPKRDALEVFYLGVVLGFRGLYSLPEATFLATQLNLPTTVDAWAKNASSAIQLRQGRPPIRETPRPASSAPPLEGKFLFVGSSLVTVILAALTAMLIYFNNIL